MNAPKLFLALILASAPALAQESPLDRKAKHLCDMADQTAYMAMNARQYGMSLNEAVEDYGKKDATGILTKMIILAYQQPIREGDAAKDAAIAEFRTQSVLACYKANP